MGETRICPINDRFGFSGRESFIPFAQNVLLPSRGTVLIQSWVFILVLITSRGVVGSVAMSPANPEQRKYLKVVSSFSPISAVLSSSLSATINALNGTFVK